MRDCYINRDLSVLSSDIILMMRFTKGLAASFTSTTVSSEGKTTSRQKGLGAKNTREASNPYKQQYRDAQRVDEDR